MTEPQFVPKPQINHTIAQPQVARSTPQANHAQMGLGTPQGFQSQQPQSQQHFSLQQPHSYASTALPPKQQQQQQQHGLPLPQSMPQQLPQSLTQQFQQMTTAPSMGSVGSTPSGPSSYSTTGMNSLGIVPPAGSNHSTSGLPPTNHKSLDHNQAHHNSYAQSSGQGDSGQQHFLQQQSGLPQQQQQQSAVDLGQNSNINNNDQGGEVRYNGTELVMLYDYKVTKKHS